ncbi:TetR/AcrR family transcriptional regulator [Pseudonocardia pini]|uniref:TetR/AcrR family transcriptional regulator n=1 Tax=Pseudonocardia pini TaxID=2758030 RepID=UPI0015EFE562|nr:TetR/AcrR family transcriptional regulator [Pseudonocardia pini]
MTRRRGGRQPAPLTGADLREAALRVVARSSLDRLTVREVAQELGVTAPAVHYHLRGGADLADRVVEAVAAGIELRDDPDLDWVERYVALVDRMDQAFLRYPGTGLRALTATGPSAAADRLTAAALDILLDAGFDRPAATEIFASTYLLFTGWLATRGRTEQGSVHPAWLAAAGHGGSGPLHAALRRVLTGTPVPTPDPTPTRGRR